MPGSFSTIIWADAATLPSSFGVELTADKWGAGLKAKFRKGFVYSDARVDDARLVVANAIGARERGADIRPRTRMVEARRDAGCGGSARATHAGEQASCGHARSSMPRVPGSSASTTRSARRGASETVRHVKGSHIVVPRVHSGRHAYILQNADKRIVFVIPYQEKFSLIGTTDIAVEEYEQPRITAEEIDYLCKIASTYLTRKLTPADVVWTYSGVRPLYDDGSADPAAVTRDYVLKLDRGNGDQAPLLSIFGGKITTYRRLAEAALSELAAFFPAMGRPWTRSEPLPGGDMPRGDVEAYGRELAARYPGVPADVREALLHRHGTRAPRVLGDAPGLRADLGTHFGAHAVRGGSGLSRGAGMGAQRRGRPLAPYQVRTAPHRRRSAMRCRSICSSNTATGDARRDAAASGVARLGCAADARCVHRHRRYAVDTRQDHGPCLRRDGAAARAPGCW